MKFNLFGRTFYFLADANQQEKAIMMLEKYIFKPENLILLTFLVIYIIALIVAKIKNNVNLINLLKKVSPWVYLVVILGITILNRTSGDREIRFYHDVWFTPTGFHESNVLGFLFNLMIYIPFGYLLYMFLSSSKKWLLTIGVVFMSSIMIEIMQYVFARGVTAIDDLIANAIGGVVGLIFAIVVDNMKQKKHKLE